MFHSYIFILCYCNQIRIGKNFVGAPMHAHRRRILPQSVMQKYMEEPGAVRWTVICQLNTCIYDRYLRYRRIFAISIYRASPRVDNGACNNRYTPPTRLNYQVASRRRCVYEFAAIAHDNCRWIRSTSTIWNWLSRLHSGLTTWILIDIYNFSNNDVIMLSLQLTCHQQSVMGSS